MKGPWTRSEKSRLEIVVAERRLAEEESREGPTVPTVPTVLTVLTVTSAVSNVQAVHTQCL